MMSTSIELVLETAPRERHAQMAMVKCAEIEIKNPMLPLGTISIVVIPEFQSERTSWKS